MEHQALIPVVSEKKAQKEVVNILKEYQALKMRLEDELTQDNINVFPELRDSKEICKLKVRRIEKVLNEILDTDERNIIMMKFLTNKNLKDSYVQNELMLSNSYFYQKKKNAIKLIAIALGII
ncbi:MULTISPECIES: ArpU family transcriptional regulator [Bacillus cereus group]|uniref:ArpU family transcriptional regulator n=1 Tax=Bacillus cereus group TaxID=86661 RepID=UPI000BEE284A|nr:MULTISPECIES: ArpU family transcriptional regulator [Bacillus cereus group]MBJ8078473.1 ArpU family transcriptional regulator [Bacillus cereus group sp. N12]PDY93493.1 ArpU family transcriptional regulator [Bacillus toyonensis]